ncbi:CBS domain-containing protein [Dactylosporangium sp. CA-139066]|uniref:CBS domain-containing protein n=1 Tax=Dactylosporangium sp. CA-139066 TaxID=3239930 RepID=UPI003D928BA8
MKKLSVADVMTPEVVVATAECRTRQIIDVLTDFGVSGLPVVDARDRVIGVVSEAELLGAVDEAAAGGAGAVTQRTAAELMTAPAVTIGPDAPLTVAARLMGRHRVKRLPVVEEGTGRLVGIVTRGDLIRRTLRSDVAIEHQVVDEVIMPAFGVDPERIAVDVADGTVTLSGDVERRSAAMRLAAGVRAVDGVAAVADRLHWRVDDTAIGRRPARTG